MLGFYTDKLDLSSTQQDQMKAIWAKEQPTLQPLMQQMQQNHEAMKTLEASRPLRRGQNARRGHPERPDHDRARGPARPHQVRDDAGSDRRSENEIQQLEAEHEAAHEGDTCRRRHNGIWILFPLVIRRAIDDLNQGVTRHKLLLPISTPAAGDLRRQGHLPVSHSLDHDRGLARIEFDLRNDLFAHLERLSYSFYQRTRTGDIMARATNDLNAVRMLLGPAIMYSANTVVFTAGALVFMLSISPRLTCLRSLPLPVASIIVQYFGRRIHERFERIQAMFSDISARAQENFSGARLIRAYVQEEAEIASFERDNTEYINRSLKLVRLMGMLWPTLETLLGVAIVIVLWVGGREVFSIASPWAASWPSTPTWCSSPGPSSRWDGSSTSSSAAPPPWAASTNICRSSPRSPTNQPFELRARAVVGERARTTPRHRGPRRHRVPQS
jgi:hypothetical protein